MRKLARTTAHPMRRLAIAAPLATSVTTACTLTPDYDQPPLVSTLSEADQYTFSDAALRPFPAEGFVDWWESLGGEEVSKLADELMVENLDLDAARHRIDQARALTRQARAARRPSASVSVDGGASRTSTLGADAEWDELYSFSGTASWDLDIFGELRASELAARLTEESSALSARSTAQLLTAELVNAYINAWTLVRRIQITEASAASFAETVNITDERYRAGSSGASALDVQIARQNQASAEAALPELRAFLAVQQQAIDVLLARPPGETQLSFAAPPDAWDLEPLAIGTPADLLRRRPDVASAELNYRAAIADVGAARANRLPSLSLSGSVSQQTNDVSDLFDTDALLSSLTGSLLAPIFQGGRLKAQVALAEASAAELASSYASAALDAVTDVESALVFETAYNEELSLRRTSLDAAELSDQIARERYASGQTTILTVLETQRSLNTARQDLVLAEQTRLEARVDLYLALGGDWRTAAAQEKDEHQ